VAGIDLTPAMIDRAKALQQAHGLANLTWRIGPVLPLPFPDASFSLVFTRSSFHHVLDPKAVLAEMVRVCSPGVRVAVVDVFTSSPERAEAFNRMEMLRDPSQGRALALDELTGLFGEAGLQSVRRQFYKHEFDLEPVLHGRWRPGGFDTARCAPAPLNSLTGKEPRKTRTASEQVNNPIALWKAPYGRQEDERS
jgi:SAM-dependent methyltransferase